MIRKGEQKSINDLQTMIKDLEDQKRNSDVPAMTDEEFENYQFRKVKGFASMNAMAL